MKREEFVRHFQRRAARTSVRNWLRWTWARLLGRVAVALIVAGPAMAGNYEQDNYDGSFGDAGTPSAAHRDPASGSCWICAAIVGKASERTGGAGGMNGGAIGGANGSIGGFGCCH